MKILILEDEENTIALLQKGLVGQAGIETVVARSRQSGMAAVDAHDFDLVILDLRIPTEDYELDADASHGLAVWGVLKERHKAPQVVLFSGHAARNQMGAFLNNSVQYDFWGTENLEPAIQYIDKTDFGGCVQHILNVRDQIGILDGIEVSYGMVPLTLTSCEMRILRVFARLNGGRFVNVRGFDEGLSKAKTLRVEVRDSQGHASCLAVAKIGPQVKIKDEYSRYRKFALPNVSCGAIAYVLNYLDYDVDDTAALFYGLAIGHNESLLDILVDSEETALVLLERLKDKTATWRTQSAKTLTVAQLRNEMALSDETTSKSAQDGLDWQRVDQKQVTLRWYTQHGDLHGLNVLVKDRQDVVMIDFGETETRPACLDPLTLELSLLFHPACRVKAQGWPTVEQAENWSNLDTYLLNCPFPNFVRLCRQWAYEDKVGDSGVVATAYCYAVRQLKYDNDARPLAVAVAKCTAGMLL